MKPNKFIKKIFGTYFLRGFNWESKVKIDIFKEIIRMGTNVSAVRIATTRWS